MEISLRRRGDPIVADLASLAPSTMTDVIRIGNRVIRYDWQFVHS